jgi:hypothetical protein
MCEPQRLRKVTLILNRAPCTRVLSSLESRPRLQGVTCAANSSKYLSTSILSKSVRPPAVSLCTISVQAGSFHGSVFGGCGSLLESYFQCSREFRQYWTLEGLNDFESGLLVSVRNDFSYYSNISPATLILVMRAKWDQKWQGS